MAGLLLTMWVGKYTGFERRVGLFPVKFDKEGRMKVYTRFFGEYPSYIPQKKFDPDKINWTGWNLLSKDKECTASSFEKGKRTFRKLPMRTFVHGGLLGIRNRMNGYV